jgi:hypothetical protein
MLNHNDTIPFGTEDASESCVLCGRKIGASPKWVAAFDGGQIWSAAFGKPDQNDSGYMGFYPVGSSTCAKQFAAGVLFDTI